MPTVLVDQQDGVATLTLNRPEVRNAISRELTEEIHAALADLSRDANVRALVITGAGGKAFAGGADIGELLERSAEDAFLGINSLLFNRIEQHPVPVIAAIEGYALGGGLELALACDLRVAARTAKMGQPEVSLGIIPGAGGPHRLTRLVGSGRARELVYTGRIVSADEAHGMGLVEVLVDEGQALAAAHALAHQIAKQSPLAVRMSKIALNQAAGALDPNTFTQMLAQAVCFESPDKRERMEAFLARKKGAPP